MSSKGEGQVVRVPGHQIAEMALAKLYRITGEKKYIDQAKFFLDKRGYTSRTDEYSQAHKPVLEQDEAVGHAVRAAYMYAGMADVAAMTGDKSYIEAIDRIWDNIVSKKLYITGGIGATNHGEAFGKNYQLPNMSAYCETCAAIGNVYVNHRLFLLHGESKYYDVLERTLYNGLISGISLDGGGFFYPNPLQSMGQHQRKPWFGCACCPSNVCRFIPSLPGYIYAVKDKDVYVNLFMSNEANLTVGGKKVTLKQTTEYPWNGDVNVEVTRNSAGQFAMKIRIPGWVKGEVVPSDLYTFTDGKRLKYNVKVNGEEVTAELQNGYFTIDRKWKKGDKVSVHFDMEPRTVKAHGKVEADRGRIAIERGPVVYCAEWPDNDFDVLSVLMNRNPKFEVESASMTIENAGVTVTHPFQKIKTSVQTLSYDENGRLTAKDHTMNMIPYYAWAHRGTGNMAVWLPINVTATSPVTAATLASKSKIDASHKATSLSSITDGLVPADENDRTIPYYHWWPKEGTTEWISYEFPTEMTISSATVYWYDDAPWGGCRVPKSWKVYYKDAAGNWAPVQNPDKYGVVKGNPNVVNFDPVKTKAVKLEVVQPEKNASGIFEWEVK